MNPPNDFAERLVAIRATRKVDTATCDTSPCLLEPLPGQRLCYYHTKIAAGVLTKTGGGFTKR